MSNVISIQAERQQRDRPRLLLEMGNAGRAWAELVQMAADVTRGYRQRGGDALAEAVQAIVGTALMSDLRAAGDRLRAAREACAAAGLSLNEPDVEIVNE